MKKLILSIALLSVILVSAKNVNPINTNSNSKLTYVTNVNSFCKLIQMGDFEAVKSLIEQGIDVNKKSTGLTPLMFAARHNKTKIAKLLIENGAKLNTKSNKGITALKFAELSHANESAQLIKNAIAEKNKRNK